jgi:hypothetical protein
MLRLTGFGLAFWGAGGGGDGVAESDGVAEGVGLCDAASSRCTSAADIGLTVLSVMPAPSTETAAVPTPIAHAAVAAHVAKTNNVRRFMGMDCATVYLNGLLRRQ